MNKKQAGILIANARAFQILWHRDNQDFDKDARTILREIAGVFEELKTDQPELIMALTIFQETLRQVIVSLPTRDHLTVPDPVWKRAETCNAIVEFAKLADD